MSQQIILSRIEAMIPLSVRQSELQPLFMEHVRPLSRVPGEELYMHYFTSSSQQTSKMNIVGNILAPTLKTKKVMEFE